MRDCYLVARNAIHIRDVGLVSKLDATYTNATLHATIHLNKPATQKATIEIYDGHKLIKSCEVSFINNAEKKIAIPVASAKLWSAEIPNLYTVLIKLKNSKGVIQEIIPQRMGFREVKIENGHLLVNGKSILIKGANRHETDPLTGQTISHDAILKDIKLMKQFNINAVRTCHRLLYNKFFGRSPGNASPKFMCSRQ